MRRLFQTIVRRIRRSPNAYALVFGVCLIVFPPVYLLFGVHYADAIRTGDAAVPMPLRHLASAWLSVVKSLQDFAPFALGAMAVLGCTLVLMGITRLFRPT